MRIDPSAYCRPGTAAKLAGVSTIFINRLCNSGRIGSFQVCYQWFVSRADAAAYQPTSRSSHEKVADKGRKPTSSHVRIDPNDYVTMSTAANLAGIARQHMGREVRAGKVPGVFIDGQWIVLRSAAEAYERHPTVGRPRIGPLPRATGSECPWAPKPTRRKRTRKASA